MGRGYGGLAKGPVELNSDKILQSIGDKDQLSIIMFLMNNQYEYVTREIPKKINMPTTTFYRKIKKLQSNRLIDSVSLNRGTFTFLTYKRINISITKNKVSMEALETEC